MKRILAVVLAIPAVPLVGIGAIAIGGGLLSLDNPWVGIAFYYGVPAFVAGAVLASLAAILWRSGRPAAPRSNGPSS